MPGKKKPKAKQLDSMLLAWLEGPKKKSSANSQSAKEAKQYEKVEKQMNESKKLEVADPTNATEEELREMEIFLETVEKTANGIASTVPVMQRRKNLQYLEGILLPKDNVTLYKSPEDTEKIVSAFCQKLLKPLLKRFADPVEQCRDSAVRLVTHLLDMLTMDSVIEQFPYLIPVLMYRMVDHHKSTEDGSEMGEPSEEIRILLMKLIHVLVSKCAKAPPFVLHLRDICALIACAITHKDPDLLEAACRTAADLGSHKELGEAMRAFGTYLVEEIMPLLLHKYSRVRLQAVRAMHYLIPCGAGESIRDLAAFKEYNMIVFKEFYEGAVRTNYMGQLVVDSNIKVRSAFIEMVCDWIINMPERGHYETLITPYVLSGLHDKNPEIQEMSLNCLKEMGRVHEEWQQRELEDEIYYMKEVESESRAHLHSLNAILPAPWTERPSLGTRLVLRKFIPRYLPAILAELSDWKEAPQENAICLLRTLLVLGEEYITSSIQDMLPAFENICTRDTIAPEAIDCMMLLGRYGSLSHSLQIISRHIMNQIGDPHQRRGSLTLLSYIFLGVPPMSLPESMPTFLGMLLDEDFCHTYDVGFFTCLVKLTKVLATIAVPACYIDEQSEKVFFLSLHLMAWLTLGRIKMAPDLFSEVYTILTDTIMLLGDRKKSVLGADRSISSIFWLYSCSALSQLRARSPELSKWTKLSFETSVLVCLVSNCKHGPAVESDPGRDFIDQLCPFLLKLSGANSSTFCKSSAMEMLAKLLTYREQAENTTVNSVVKAVNAALAHYTSEVDQISQDTQNNKQKQLDLFALATSCHTVLECLVDVSAANCKWTGQEEMISQLMQSLDITEKSKDSLSEARDTAALTSSSVPQVEDQEKQDEQLAQQCEDLVASLSATVSKLKHRHWQMHSSPKGASSSAFDSTEIEASVAQTNLNAELDNQAEHSEASDADELD
mmetsp:Transcript_41037/g.80500  ORF Transcript_41037/g.80500 Transcript_41037/m.80500 type:complete len:949 (-) Transcript_41037:49-2895(-)